MKTKHLDIIASFDYAAGEVDGSYPNPVESDNILDLLAFDASKHDAKWVTISLSNKYCSDCTGTAINYQAASIGCMTEESFRVRKSSSLISDGFITFSANRVYSHESIYSIDAKSIPELLSKLVQSKVKGTLDVVFCNYPYGINCIPEVVKKFRICF